MNASERVRDALQERPLTVNEIHEETGVNVVSVRKILGIAIAFGAVSSRRNPGMKLMRYSLNMLMGD